MNQKENIIKTFTDMAPNYEEIVNSELTRFWGISYHQFVSMLLELTPLQEKGNILDIATGTGVIPTKLMNNNGDNHQIHGLDITHSMLIQAKRNLIAASQLNSVKLTCASAMQMPYAPRSFDLIFCGLATHHMDVTLLLEEAYRILRPGGQLSFADVGSSPLWNIPGIKWSIRLLAFVFYMAQEGVNRAWAESSAVSNVLTTEEWFSALSNLNFKNITIRKLKSKYVWIPSPLVIRAEKMEEE